MAKAPTKTKPKTPARVIVDFSTGELTTVGSSDFAKFRTMRKDPTIALCRVFAAAPILASTWQVEGDDPHQKEFIEDQFQTLRTPLLRTALFGQFDFGWKAYELVYGQRDFEFSDGTTQRLNVIQQVRPLKNDDTLARYDKDSGDFIGFSTVDRYSGTKIYIDAEHSLFINFDDEGLGDYAQGTMAIVESIYDAWEEANDVAGRYDKKMAGMYLVVYYPVGKTSFNAVETDNAEIAQAIIAALKGSGSVSIPVEVQDIVTDLQKTNTAWKIEFLDPGSKQASFVDRQKYLDALKARAAGLPERAILEGEFGTKAEAGIHASAALLTIHLKHENITELLNLGPVNQLLEANWGTRGTAWLKAMPLTDEKAGIFKEIFMKLLDDPSGGPDVFDAIDAEQLADAIGLPVRDRGDEQVTPLATEPVAENPQQQQSMAKSISIQVA
jgi:hypothetical protein